MSLGPFFKSFGPTGVTGSFYDIPFEGVNGLFTATANNDIRITFNSTDWSGAIVSWIFLGSN